LTKQVIELALRSILGPKPLKGTKLDEFTSETLIEFLKWFPFDAWYSRQSLVTFESQSFSVRIELEEGFSDLRAEFSPDFVDTFSDLSEQIEKAQSGGPDFRLRIAEQVRAQLLLLISGSEVDDPFIDRAVFIPDGRGFFANPSLGFSLINSPDIDPLLKEFSLEVSWGTARAPNPILGPQGVLILSQIGREMDRVLGGHVEGQNGGARFRRDLDGKSIPLPFLSSGTQAILPMLNVLWQLITDQRDRIIFPRPDNLPGLLNKLIESKGLVYLEEPEANIFPSTQSDLVRLFTWLSNEQRTDFSWMITTHSPYILTSFNNLIEAGQAARNNPELKDAVAKIVPEQYWIKEGEFRAYAIHDGELESILSESGFIDGNYLDQVSEVIGDEFDELLRLEYDHTEAS
jgi:hypothetical protein